MPENDVSKKELVKQKRDIYLKKHTNCPRDVVRRLLGVSLRLSSLCCPPVIVEIGGDGCRTTSVQSNKMVSKMKKRIKKKTYYMPKRHRTTSLGQFPPLCSPITLRCRRRRAYAVVETGDGCRKRVHSTYLKKVLLV